MINKIKGYLGCDVLCNVYTKEGKLLKANVNLDFELAEFISQRSLLYFSKTIVRFEEKSNIIKPILTRIMDISQKDLIQLNILIGLADSNYGENGLSRYDLLRYINNNKRRLTYAVFEYLHKNHIDYQNLIAEDLAIKKEQENDWINKRINELLSEWIFNVYNIIYDCYIVSNFF